MNFVVISILAGAVSAVSFFIFDYLRNIIKNKYFSDSKLLIDALIIPQKIVSDDKYDSKIKYNVGEEYLINIECLDINYMISRISLLKNIHVGYHLIIDFAYESVKYKCEWNINTEENYVSLFFYENNETDYVLKIFIYLDNIKIKNFINSNYISTFLEDGKILNAIFLNEQYIYNTYSKLKDNSRMLI